jgi:hypothetical protein
MESSMSEAPVPAVEGLTPEQELTAKALAALKAPPPMPFDPKNYLVIMMYIQHFFELSHAQMLTLRTRIEKTFNAQPQVFSKKAPAPVTLNGVAITYGLMVGFGGLVEALRASPDRVVKLAGHMTPTAISIRSYRSRCTSRRRRINGRGGGDDARQTTRH